LCFYSRPFVHSLCGVALCPLAGDTIMLFALVDVLGRDVSDEGVLCTHAKPDD